MVCTCLTIHSKTVDVWSIKEVLWTQKKGPHILTGLTTNDTFLFLENVHCICCLQKSKPLTLSSIVNEPCELMLKTARKGFKRWLLLLLCANYLFHILFISPKNSVISMWPKFLSSCISQKTPQFITQSFFNV